MQRLYVAKIRQLEQENLNLNVKNYKLLEKLQKTQKFLVEYANEEIEEEDDQQLFD